MSNTDFALAVEDLTVSFDGFKAIDALTLYIDKNELRVIIGPNGAGKTTLLDLICGKTRASAGSIKFKNTELTRMAEYRRVRLGIGRKFQTPSIYENLSVFQNLEVSFPAGLAEYSAREVERLMRELENAGARVVKRAKGAASGGHSGYVADPDGFLWEIAYSPDYFHT